MAQNLVSNTRRANWIVTWNGFSFGYADETDPGSLKLMLEDIKVGTVGKATLGKRFLGLEGTLKFNFREITKALIGNLCPWYNGPSLAVSTSGPWLLTPPVNIDLYVYAAALNLAPTDLIEQASPDHSQDINLIAAVPISVPNAFKRDGTKDDVWPVEFAVFPVRNGTNGLTGTPPGLNYGFVGPSSSFSGDFTL